MFKFITNFFHGFEDSASHEEVLRAVDEGLDIRSAISAHENWKVRLDLYLAGQSNEDLRPEVICFDDRCDLGKWIHSTGKARLGRFPGFTALVSDHKQFHYAASNVVALSKAGKLEDAKRMLAGPYDRSSKSVAAALTDMLHLTEHRRSKA